MKRIILPNGDILFLSAITKITKISKNSINSYFEIHYIDGYTTLRDTDIRTTWNFVQLNNFLDNKDLILNLENDVK